MRKRTINRTITTMKVLYFAIFDGNKMEEREATIPAQAKAEKVLKFIKENVDEEAVKVAAIETVEKMYSMSESKFMSEADEVKEV